MITQGSDNSIVFNAIVAFTKDSQVPFINAASGIASIGGYTVRVERSVGGTGMAYFGSMVTVPQGKNVVFDSVRTGTLVWYSPPAVPRIVRFMNQGQSANFGIKNTMFWGGVFQVVGSNNGHNIDFHNLAFIKNYEKPEFTDRNIIEPTYTGNAKANATNFNVHNWTAYGGAGILNWESATYAHVTFSELRCINNMSKSHMRITNGDGLTFQDCGFRAVVNTQWQDSCYVHIDPSETDTVSSIRFSGSLIIGSEDSANLGVQFEPAKYIFYIGGFGEAYNANKRVSHMRIDGGIFNSSRPSNPSYATQQCRSAFKINCRYNNWRLTIDNRDEFPDGFIDQTGMDGSGQVPTNCILDSLETSTSTGTVFNPDLGGWDQRALTSARIDALEAQSGGRIWQAASTTSGAFDTAVRSTQLVTSISRPSTGVFDIVLAEPTPDDCVFSARVTSGTRKITITRTDATNFVVTTANESDVATNANFEFIIAETSTLFDGNPFVVDGTGVEYGSAAWDNLLPDSVTSSAGTRVNAHSYDIATGEVFGKTAELELIEVRLANDTVEKQWRVMNFNEPVTVTDPTPVDITPTLSFATPVGLTVDYATAGYQTGRYTIEGDWVSFILEVKGAMTHTTGSSDLIVSGLPAADDFMDDGQPIGACVFEGLDISSITRGVIAKIQGGDLHFVQVRDDSGVTTVSGSQIVTGSDVVIKVSGKYLRDTA